MIELDPEAVRSSVDHLRTIDVGDPLGAPRLLASIAREVDGLFSGASISAAYRPALAASDWLVAAEGPRAPDARATFADIAGAWVADPSRKLFLYDPLRPSASERNVVRSIRFDQTPPPAMRAYSRIGPNVDQTRTLVCDGPILLAWIGLLHAPGQMRARHRRALRILARGVRRRLRLAIGIPRAMERATFEASLDAYAGEAYVVRATGRVEYANTLGHARLAAASRDLERELAESLSRFPTQSGTFELHPLGGRGMPAFFLATRPSVTPNDLDARLKHAAARWALTPRHVDVLRRLALGDANKEIASRLRISARTVEEHVAAMMARAKVDSRLRLVARLWVGA